MERAGHLPGGRVSEIVNLHSGKCYVISTSPEIGEDYWSTTLLMVVEERSFFGLVRRKVIDVIHPIATWTRNNKEDAYRAHAEVHQVVIRYPESEWFYFFPQHPPPDGRSEGAKARLRAALGDDADVS